MTRNLSAPPKTAILLLAFAAIYLIWGSTFLAIRFAVQTLPPLVMMGTRQLVAGSILFAWMMWRNGTRPEPRLWLSALISGAFLFLGCHGLLAWAEIRVHSGLAALLSSTLPLWMVLLAPLHGQESELNRRVLIGIVLGMIGVAVLIPFGAQGQQGRAELWSSLAIVVSELLWAIGAIYGRGVKAKTASPTFAAMQMMAGGALLWIVGLSLGEGRGIVGANLTPRSLLSLAYLIVFGSLAAFTAYTWLLKVSSPAVVSTHSYVNPVVAVVLGWMLAGEAITLRTIAGTAIILASVALVSIRKKKDQEPTELPEKAVTEMAG